MGSVTITDSRPCVVCPVGEPVGDGYRQTTVQVKSLTPRQAAGLQRLTAALRSDNARVPKSSAATADGVVVDLPADAVRWLLDRLGLAYELHDAAAKREGGDNGQ